MLVVAKGSPHDTTDPSSLVILVTSDRHLDHVINLTMAAHAKGKQVSLCFTGRGVLLTVRPEFERLVGRASLSICDASFRASGLHGREGDIPGVTPADFVTQTQTAERLAAAHRHLVF